jgi:hypothetical protein
MIEAAKPRALMPISSARRLSTSRSTLRACAALTLMSGIMLLMGCPHKQNSAVNYVDAESSLRLAINVNEVAYNSWNKVYEGFGALHRDSKVSEARWASISAIDGVIVLSEADLIEGIERSKKLLEVWRHTSTKVLSAESAQDVNQLRERELEARHNFSLSMDYLNGKSLKLRDSYAEAVLVADSVIKDGHPLPMDHIAAIRQIVKMVDQELARTRTPNNAAAGKQVKKDSTAPVATSIK